MIDRVALPSGIQLLSALYCGRLHRGLDVHISLWVGRSPANIHCASQEPSGCFADGDRRPG